MGLSGESNHIYHNKGVSCSLGCPSPSIGRSAVERLFLEHFGKGGAEFRQLGHDGDVLPSYSFTQSTSLICGLPTNKGGRVSPWRNTNFNPSEESWKLGGIERLFGTNTLPEKIDRSDLNIAIHRNE
jgi:hypothetical protein